MTTEYAEVDLPDTDAADAAEAPAKADKVDPEALLKSLNGHDLVLIKQMFGFVLTNLEDDAMQGIYALQFIRIFRRTGKKDAKAAKRAALDLTIGELMDIFDMEDLAAAAAAEDPMGEG